MTTTQPAAQPATQPVARSPLDVAAMVRRATTDTAAQVGAEYRDRIVEAYRYWDTLAQRTIDAAGAERAAYGELSVTSLALWPAAHHAWVLAADATREAVTALLGPSWSVGPLDTPDSHVAYATGLDPWVLERIRRALGEAYPQPAVTAHQVREALGGDPADYADRLQRRGELASHTLTRLAPAALSA